ncbi:MAG: serine hydrolase, partial [Patescibacteria group bacterium]
SEEVVVSTQEHEKTTPHNVSWGLPFIALIAVVVGWFLFRTITPPQVRVVERVTFSKERYKDMPVRRYSTLRDLEQPHFTEARQPLTALISNFDVPDIEINARAVLVNDLTTHVDLFLKNQDVVWPIASITKLLTATAAKEVGITRQFVTITKEAIATEGNGGNLVVGEKFSLEGITQVMLFVSSNDAAKAIEGEIGEELLFRMKGIVNGLGLSRTHIEEVTGLSPQNVSTARELKNLVQYIYRVHPELFRMTKTSETVISSETKKHKLVNINYLSLHPELGFIGGKTGTIDESGQNIVALFEHNNHTIIVIVLGSSDRFKDVEELMWWVKRAYVFK